MFLFSALYLLKPNHKIACELFLCSSSLLTNFNLDYFKTRLFYFISFGSLIILSNSDKKFFFVFYKLNFKLRSNNFIYFFDFIQQLSKFFKFIIYSFLMFSFFIFYFLWFFSLFYPKFHYFTFFKSCIIFSFFVLIILNKKGQ